MHRSPSSSPSASSCAVESTRGRCEAFASTGDGLCPQCFAIEDRSEIVVDPCGGPLGPWSAVGSDGDGAGSCGASLVPPEPALCSCAPAQCDV